MEGEAVMGGSGWVGGWACGCVVVYGDGVVVVTVEIVEVKI